MNKEFIFVTCIVYQALLSNASPDPGFGSRALSDRIFMDQIYHRDLHVNHHHVVYPVDYHVVHPVVHPAVHPVVHPVVHPANHHHVIHPMDLHVVHPVDRHVDNHVVHYKDQQIYGKNYHFNGQKATFFQAKSHCARNGGKLFEPKNELIYYKIAVKAKEIGLVAPWIGLKKIANNSSFVYDFDNKKVVWTNWDLNEPNGALVGEGCVHMATNMKWNDNNCLRKFNFICEKI